MTKLADSNLGAQILCLAALSFSASSCSEQQPALKPLDQPVSQEQDIFLVERSGKQHLVTISGEVGKTGFDEIEYDPTIGRIVGKKIGAGGEVSKQILNEWTGAPAHEKSYSGFESRGGGTIYGIEGNCGCICCEDEKIELSLDLDAPKAEPATNTP